MVLRSAIQLSCTPEKAWDFVSDPAMIVRWNDRIRTIVPISSGPWAANSRFRMRYEIASAAGNYLCEILEHDRPVRMVIHLTGGDLPSRGYLQEVFEIGEAQGRTVVKHEVALYGAGRNPFSSVLLFLSHLLPRSRGKKCLRRLKELVEGGGSEG